MLKIEKMVELNRKEKTMVKAKKKSSKKAKKAKAKTAKDEKKMDRMEASVIVLTGIRDRMAYHTAQQKADELYAQNGGVLNPKESAYAFKRASKVMVLLKMFEIKDGHLIRLK